MKRILLFLLPALLLFADEIPDNHIVAIVEKEVFTTMDVRKNCEQEVARLKQHLTGEELKQKTAEAMRSTLDFMINQELFYLEFKALKGTVPTQLVQERLDQAITKSAGGDEILFEEQLYNSGMTMKELREKITKDIAVQLLLRHKVQTGVSIPDNAIERYYKENKHLFVRPIRFHIAVIQLKKDGRYADRFDAVIGEIKEKIKLHEPFEALAKQYSEGANAENGGDQGWMNDMNPTIKEVVINLKQGEVSTIPVTIGSNTYFLKNVEIEGGGVPQLTKELQDYIRDVLTKKEEGERFDKLLNELKMKYAVKRMDDFK